MAHLVGSGVTTKWTGCGRLQDHKHDSRAVIGEERTISFGNQSPFSSLHDSPAVVLASKTVSEKTRVVAIIRALYLP